MSLPAVHGWLIDFRTARIIFQSGKNDRIAHCVDMCEQSKLWICHCDEEFFRTSNQLCGPFIEDHYRVQEPDEQICTFCGVIDANPNGQKRQASNEAALYITAAAMTKGYGVISNHRSTSFATVYDLCKTYGVPVFSADEYFDLLS